MILYRVVSEAELAAYLKGQNIKPGKDCVPNNNSWKRPKVCFFGTANNCTHWQPICAGHVIVKLDVRGTYMKIKKGWGIYPDFDAPEQPEWTGDLMTDIQEVMLKQKTVRVKEYGVGAYNKRNAYLRDWSFVWGRDYIHFEKGGIVPRLPGYDDLLEGEK